MEEVLARSPFLFNEAININGLELLEEVIFELREASSGQSVSGAIFGILPQIGRKFFQQLSLAHLL